LEIKSSLTLLQSVGSNFRFFFLNGSLDGLNLIVWVNINVKGLSAKLNLDGDSVEVGSKDSSRLDSRVIDGLGIIKSLTIKDKIMTKEGIDAGRYKLVKANGEALDDTKTIYNSGIKSGAVLTADFNTISIKVKLGTKTLDIDVDPDNKVESIKAAIKEKEPEVGAYTLKKGETTLDLQKTI
jgi:hypothetical protein